MESKVADIGAPHLFSDLIATPITGDPGVVLI